jgi:hypothetical protein
VKGDLMKKLIEAIDDARPENPGSRYAIGYDDGLKKAKQILEKAGVVSLELYNAVRKERDIAMAYVPPGKKAPDVVRVVRCGKCKHWDVDTGYCIFWHGARSAGHYCEEGEKKDG